VLPYVCCISGFTINLNWELAILKLNGFNYLDESAAFLKLIQG